MLSIYLSVSKSAVSSALVREENGVQLPVYFTSKRLLDAETRYTEMEKLALALVVASRKLRHYFQAHSIRIMTNHPLRQVMQKTDASGRLLKWAVELSQFDLIFKPRTAMKGQSLADFVAEFTDPVDEQLKQTEEVPKWKLYVDGSSNENGCGAGIILITPEGHRVTSAIKFSFQASNNEAEYEALLAGLRLAENLKAENIEIFSDSQLVVNHVKNEYQAKGERMTAYLAEVRKALSKFKSYDLSQIPRTENAGADALARLATSKQSELLRYVPVEVLVSPAIGKSQTMQVEPRPCWMDPIIRYLTEGELPEGRQEARRLRHQASRYTMLDGLLYRRGFSSPLLRCLSDEESRRVMTEIHDGICGNHSGGQSLAHKVLRQGYFWPTLKKDAINYAKKCDSCQRYAPIPRTHSGDLTSIVAPWPFAKWGIDLIGPLHKTPGGHKFAIVAVDYYTKWAEAEPLTTVSEIKCTNFIWNNIVCRFGVPHSIVSDNGKQFDNDNTNQFCELLGIHKNFSSVVYPQSNGQVEAVNKIIKTTLKRRLDRFKGKWAEELPKVLWAYRTTSRTTTGETPFSMAFGVEAVLPVEVSIPTNRVKRYDEVENSARLGMEIDMLEEKRLNAELRIAAYQARTARYYNRRVKEKHFKRGDLVLRVVTPNTKPKNSGALGPTWEGPYRICEVIANGSYRLAELDGRNMRHTWNANQLKMYYQ